MRFDLETRNNLINYVILVSTFFGWTRNNQRSSRFVDQNGVHFVDDGKMMFALNIIGQIEFHIVAKIVKTKFVIGTVGDVAAIRGLALLIGEIVNNNPN